MLRDLPRGEGKSTGADAPITIDDFAKVDLRIAKIQNAEHVEGADLAPDRVVDVERPLVGREAEAVRQVEVGGEEEGSQGSHSIL